MVREVRTDAHSDAAPDRRWVYAPADCTQAAGLRGLVADVRRLARRGGDELTIDLSRVQHMNARLLATVLLLTRDVLRTGGRLRIEGVSEDFRKWARTFHILKALERRGVIAPSPESTVKV